MADKKISALDGATTPLAGTEVLPIVQGGQTVKVPANQLLSFGSANGVVYLNGSNVATAGTGLVYNGSQLGIGVAPAAPLHVYAGASNEALRLDAASPSNTGINWYSNGVIKFAMQLLGDGTDAFRLYNFNTGADAVVVDSSSNLKINTGNLVQGTAAKGVNFTANTPQPGMTSQLLNAYEEGTWTPVVAATSGSITSYTASGTYTKVGRLVTATFTYNITNAGAGSGAITVTAPFAAGSGANYPTGSSREVAVAGWGGYTGMDPSGTTVTVQKYDGGFAGATGVVVRGTISYQV